jgi:hypothetical protein
VGRVKKTGRGALLKHVDPSHPTQVVLMVRLVPCSGYPYHDVATSSTSSIYYWFRYSESGALTMMTASSYCGILVLVFFYYLIIGGIDRLAICPIVKFDPFLVKPGQ